MKHIKPLRELTIKHNFMFGAVMQEEELCKHLLEMILNIKIARIIVHVEKSIVYHPGYKGVRLDVYAQDEENTHYNIEMQATSEKELPKRARYYHSQIDMELLERGAEYEELPKSYVIFICDFDPFGEGKYQYTLKTRMSGEPDIYEDGNTTIFLNTLGKDPQNISENLRKFLDFVHADLDDSTKEYEDDFVQKLQDTIASIKRNRSMEERYMSFELAMHDARRAGREEGREEGRLAFVEGVLEELSGKGSIPDSLRDKINDEHALGTLKKWLKLAILATTVEEFEKSIQ